MISDYIKTKLELIAKATPGLLSVGHSPACSPTTVDVLCLTGFPPCPGLVTHFNEQEIIEWKLLADSRNHREAELKALEVAVNYLSKTTRVFDKPEWVLAEIEKLLGGGE